MALKNYKKALDIRLRLLAERHPIVADTYNNMGTSFYGKGRYCIALVLFTRALKIRILIFGEENPFVADSYNNKGKCLKALGRDAEADECLKKAFLIARVFPKTAMCQRILDENQDMK